MAICGRTVHDSFLCLMLLTLTGLIKVSDGVKIHPAELSVVCYDDDPMVLLPCNFSTSTHETPLIRWFTDEEIVKFDFNNRLVASAEFNGRAYRGDRGALALLQPTVNDTGNYSCEVEVDNEQPNWAMGAVELYVHPRNRSTRKAESSPEIHESAHNFKAWVLMPICLGWFMTSAYIAVQKIKRRSNANAVKLNFGLKIVFFCLSLVLVLLALLASISAMITLSATSGDSDLYCQTSVACGVTANVVLLLLGFLEEIVRRTCPCHSPTHKKAQNAESGTLGIDPDTDRRLLGDNDSMSCSRVSENCEELANDKQSVQELCEGKVKEGRERFTL